MLFVFEKSNLTFFLCTNAVTFYMQLWDLLWFYILALACNVCAIMLYAQGKKKTQHDNTTFATHFMG